MLLGLMISKALSGCEKDQVLDSASLHISEPNVKALSSGSYRCKQRSEVAGTGYAVASLEAALWCFHTTSTLEDAILAAANLGDDTDTTAAITGQLAGAFYGIGAVPGPWLDKLWMREEIAAAARALFTAAQER